MYSTFVGGSNNDWSYGITIDSNENIYIAGEIQSADFPTTPDAYDNIYNVSNDRVAAAAGSRLLTDVNVRNRINELLEVAGLGITDLNRKLSQLIQFKKAVIVKGRIEFVDDGAVQTENLKTAYRLHGLLGNTEGQQAVTDQRSIHFHITDNKIKELRSIINDLKEMDSNDSGSNLGNEIGDGG